MPIIKIIKPDKYAQISNDLLNDPELSLRAKGLLCYLISKPVTWNVNVNHLYKVCKEGKDAIYSTINELVEAGYIVRVRTKDSQGRHLGVDYHVYENPQREKPDVEFPSLEKPDHSNTEALVNKELSNGSASQTSAKPSEEKKEDKSPERIMYEKKVVFLKLIIDFAAENPRKYPKLMYVEFAKFWLEPTMLKKKVKLRYEDQQYFDIGRRLSTWFQKAGDGQLQKHWEVEENIETLNVLFKKQILKLTHEPKTIQTENNS